MFSDFRKSLEPLRENARMPVSETIKLPPFPTNCIPPQSPPLIIPNNITELVSALLKPLKEGCDLRQALQWPANTNSAYPFRGGESEGLRRLDHVITSGLITTYQDTWDDMTGLNSGTKLSAYFALGCVTAGQLHAEMKSFEDGKVKREQWNVSYEDAEIKKECWKMVKGFGEGESKGSAHLRAQLAWRDFLRLVQCNIGVKTFALGGAKP